jgi:Fic family protein
MGKVAESTASGKYLHWDDLRHRTPPQGLSHLEWWIGLKLRRIAHARTIPLRGTDRQRFTFSLSDPIPERLHQFDLWAGGTVQMPEPVANAETRSAYVVRSLIEEAITSSQLEGAATTREVAKEMLRQGRPARDRSEQMILNNFRTMERILELKGEKLTTDLVFEIHRIITDRTLDDVTAAGRFRHQAEKCVVGDDYGEVFHIPPPAQELEQRMQAMIAFANEETPGPFIHPALRSMILHFWLAYDHPFVDGNGRTARALFYWSMLRHNYWIFEYISISRIILKAPARYGRAYLHTETDDNDLTYFIIYHSDVIARAITELYQYFERRSQQLRVMEAELRGMLSLNHRQTDLISHALRHPDYRYTIESHRRSHGVVYETARTDLVDLGQRGLLEQRKEGKTRVFFPARDLEMKLRRSGPRGS